MLVERIKAKPGIFSTKPPILGVADGRQRKQGVMEGRDKQNLSSCSQERQTEQDRDPEYKNGRQRWLPDGTRGCLIIWRIVRLKYEWTINPIPIHLGEHFNFE